MSSSRCLASVAERRRLLLKVLEREGAATLRALTEASGMDYHETYRALYALRDAGLIRPAINYGQRGRWEGGPVVYEKRVAIKRSRRRAHKFIERRLRGRGSRRRRR